MLAGVLLSSHALGQSAQPEASGEPQSEAQFPPLNDVEAAPPNASPTPGSQLVVRVLLKACGELRADEVERILALELAVDSSHSENLREPTWVIVQCEGSRVVLEVHDPLSRKVVQRRFDFGSARAKGRGRLVALAAAELVLASWAELAVLPEPRVEPEGPRPATEQKELARKRVVSAPVRAVSPPASPPVREGTVLLGTDPTIASEGRGARGERIVYSDYYWERLPGRVESRLLALSSVRTFVNQSGALAGGGVRFGSDLLPLHGWAVDALMESGTLGGAHIDSWSLGGMLYFLGEAGRRFVLRGGIGLRAGFMRSSRPGEGKPHLNFPVFWGWPMVSIAASARFRRFVLELTSEAGYSTLPSGPGDSDSSRGVWVNAQLGAGFAL